MEDSSWTRYEKLVLNELNRLNDNSDMISARLAKIDNDLAVIKVKAGLFGSAAAIIVTVFTILLESFLRK